MLREAPKQAELDSGGTDTLALPAQDARDCPGNSDTPDEAARMLQRIVTLQIEPRECPKRIATNGQRLPECSKRMAPIRSFELKCPAPRSFEPAHRASHAHTAGSDGSPAIRACSIER